MQKKDRHLSVTLETNLFSATTLLLRLCIFMTFFGSVISIMACTLSGLALIPLWDTMNPRNLPVNTPNAHFLDSVSCYKKGGYKRSP